MSNIYDFKTESFSLDEEALLVHAGWHSFVLDQTPIREILKKGYAIEIDAVEPQLDRPQLDIDNLSEQVLDDRPLYKHMAINRDMMERPDEEPVENPEVALSKIFESDAFAPYPMLPSVSEMVQMYVTHLDLTGESLFLDGKTVWSRTVLNEEFYVGVRYQADAPRPTLWLEVTDYIGDKLIYTIVPGHAEKVETGEILT
jgi:hypothetical protein